MLIIEGACLRGNEAHFELRLLDIPPQDKFYAIDNSVSVKLEIVDYKPILSPTLIPPLANNRKMGAFRAHRDNPNQWTADIYALPEFATDMLEPLFSVMSFSKPKGGDISSWTSKIITERTIKFDNSLRIPPANTELAGVELIAKGDGVSMVYEDTLEKVFILTMTDSSDNEQTWKRLIVPEALRNEDSRIGAYDARNGILTVISTFNVHVIHY